MDNGDSSREIVGTLDRVFTVFTGHGYRFIDESL